MNGWGSAYNSDNAVRLKQSVQILQELQSKQRNGLGTTCKHVVDDVVKPGLGRVGGCSRGVGDRVFDHGCVVAGELEVLRGELVHHGV